MLFQLLVQIFLLEFQIEACKSPKFDIISQIDNFYIIINNFYVFRTITQLEYIIAVDTFGSFSEAADKSFVTQPTLSMQIQKLEDELGILIFDRRKQPIRPTEKGERIVQQAKIILQESEESVIIH